MLVLFVLFLYYVFRQMKNDSSVHTDFVPKSTLKIWGLVLIGLTGLIIGGQFVVVNSVKIANSLGISEKIIGLTIVAAGTSLPELVTSIVAATKRNSDIAIGNKFSINMLCRWHPPRWRRFVICALTLQLRFAFAKQGTSHKPGCKGDEL